MMLMGGFDYNYLVKVDRLMVQILCGSYFALAGVVCVNLYIALLSDTFACIYTQAKANAVMQLARSVRLLESKSHLHIIYRMNAPQRYISTYQNVLKVIIKTL